MWFMASYLVVWCLLFLLCNMEVPTLCGGNLWWLNVSPCEMQGAALEHHDAYWIVTAAAASCTSLFWKDVTSVLIVPLAVCFFDITSSLRAFTMLESAEHQVCFHFILPKCKDCSELFSLKLKLKQSWGSFENQNWVLLVLWDCDARMPL